jgi:predicted transcriptional regulator
MAVNKKPTTIILRVSSDLKASLQKLADADSRKLSDFVRLHLTKLVDTSKKKTK